MTSDAIARLHATLVLRETPEAVAALVERALALDLARRVQVPLRAMTEVSLQRRWGWSSMPARFNAPVPMNRQVAKARELAALFLDGHLPESDDPDALEAFVEGFAALIGKAPGRSSFKQDRLDRAQRAGAGLTLSRRRYAKLFRLAGRLEDRLRRLRREEAKFRLVLVGKAAFVAY